MTTYTLTEAKRQQLLDALSDDSFGRNDKVYYAKLALRNLQPNTQEPVAEVESAWADQSKATVVVMHGNIVRTGTKLYTHPAPTCDMGEMCIQCPASVPPQQPLTDEQIAEGYLGSTTEWLRANAFTVAVRWAEAEHSIGVKP